MEPEEAARIRAEKIAKKQELLKEAASSLDKKLYEKLLENIDAIAADASSLEQLFREFQATEHAKVLQQFTRGVLEIGSLNASYFEAVADNLDKKDFAALKQTAQETLLNRFGLDATGRAKKGWFIDSFINDTSIPRSIRKQAIKWQASGTGLNQFKQDLKSLVLAEGNGVYSKYYNTFAMDTYQQADATIQQHYAKKLGLKAYLYSGGLMTSSRSFCTAKNGKVFTDEEVASWKDDVFQGKPKEGYNPFIDRGGYNCRHHLNAITAKMAAARRADLEVDEAGNLVKKGTVKQPETEAKTAAVKADAEKVAAGSFKPAKSIKEAETFALENNLAKRVNYSKVTLEGANKTNEVFSRMKSEGINVELEEISDMKSLYKKLGRKYTDKSKATLAQAMQMGDTHYFALGEVFKDSSAVKNYLTRLDTKDVIKNIDLDGVMYHEYGHLVDYSNSINAFQTINQELKEEFFKHVDKRFNGMKQFAETQIRKDVGSYILTNDAEFFAEGFRLWQSKTTPEHLAFIDDYFNAKFKK